MDWILRIVEIAAIVGGIQLIGRRRLVAKLRRAYSQESNADSDHATLNECVAIVRRVLYRVSQREPWREHGQRVSLRVGGVGYLHRDAIAYLRATYVVPDG
jgi:hypothetical protein